MSTYFFMKKNLTDAQVKSIIREAGYDTSGRTYTPLLDNAGIDVSGPGDMSISRLEFAAKKLKIKGVEISYSASDLTAFASGAGTDYQVQIAMPQDTVTSLSGGGYSLYAFKAVQSSQANGVPVVWFKTNTYSIQTTVNWQVNYQAYTGSETDIPNGTISANASYPATLGQQLNVTGQQGTGAVVAGGPATAISIMNQTSVPFTCGISQVIDGKSNPMCAFPLYGNGLDVMAPIEKVLLMFASKQVNTGTVIEKAYSQGVLIDLTGDNQRMVNFDINAGWSWGNYSWGQPVQANQALSPLLIDDSSVSQGNFRRMTHIG